MAGQIEIVVLVNDARHTLKRRTAALVLWLMEHEEEIPEFGNVQLDLNRGEIKPKILRSYEAIKLAAN